MALAMATPWLHPRTRVYYLRRRVPDDLKAALGRGEVRRSLGTRDPKEAKRLFAEALADLEAQWANLRGGARALTERKAHALAMRVGEAFIGQHTDYPSRQSLWRTEIGEGLFDETPLAMTGRSAVEAMTDGLDRHMVQRHAMRAWCVEAADAQLAREGLRVDPESRQELVCAIARAMQVAALRLRDMTKGGWAPAGGFAAHAAVPSLPTPAAPRGLQASRAFDSSVTFEALIAGWLRERQPAAKTAYVFPRVVRDFAAFVGHGDAARITEDDVVRWKDALLEQGLRGTTIRNGKIGPVRTILQWGVDNKKLAANVARGIKVTTKARALDRKRDPTEDEVAVILSAAAAARDPVRRWVPWLCAYTGARVAEICQLRKEDVYADAGIPVLAIRPEAGSLKNENSERTIPIHPKLIAQGFLTFADKAKPGPLFPDLPPDRFGSRGGNGSKVLGRWIRSLGLTDPRMQPNHGWRHRFSSLSRDKGLREDVTIYMLGRQKSVSGAYGGYGLPMLLEQMSRIP
ncbi:DUF6538 domain-containing protein [Methylorubrum extorquens]|uniref:DUF6538 domain-containing protein n=1 Tax=Methylorubrum extorquens TaxID=408 RepID=UPI002238210E|nr:DUF6538 domain-containing protein [Methylorubrum extorquens]UYW33524.1 integrase [Methylorubrum extorquens]